MKQLFAIFCAFILLPMFSTQAWIGGPFSNNSFGGVGGDDGVYEASATAANGIGLYRFAVGNEFAGVNPGGVNASVPSQQAVNGFGFTITVPGISSGNTVIGAFGNGFTSIWYYEGVQYFGTTIGTVNSALNVVIGMATVRNNIIFGNPATSTLSTAFRAQLVRTGRTLAATPFEGTGRARVTPGNIDFEFTVLGSKVSNNLFFGL